MPELTITTRPLTDTGLPPGYRWPDVDRDTTPEPSAPTGTDLNADTLPQRPVTDEHAETRRAATVAARSRPSVSRETLQVILDKLREL